MLRRRAFVLFSDRSVSRKKSVRWKFPSLAKTPAESVYLCQCEQHWFNEQKRWCTHRRTYYLLAYQLFESGGKRCWLENKGNVFIIILTMLLDREHNCSKWAKMARAHCFKFYNFLIWGSFARRNVNFLLFLFQFCSLKLELISNSFYDHADFLKRILVCIFKFWFAYLNFSSRPSVVYVVVQFYIGTIHCHILLHTRINEKYTKLYQLKGGIVDLSNQMGFSTGYIVIYSSME